MEGVWRRGRGGGGVVVCTVASIGMLSHLIMLLRKSIKGCHYWNDSAKCFDNHACSCLRQLSSSVVFVSGLLYCYCKATMLGPH